MKKLFNHTFFQFPLHVYNYTLVEIAMETVSTIDISLRSSSWCSDSMCYYFV